MWNAKGQEMGDGDLISLYSGRILELAANIPLVGRLAHAEGTAERVSRICGSTIIVDLCLRDGCISDFAQDVHACALGQASAAILGRVIIGRRRAEIEAARDALRAMLTQGGPVPPPPFDGYEVLIPARAFANRHASIMLALDATCDAMAAAEMHHHAGAR